jgi:hypothetical protein
LLDVTYGVLLSKTLPEGQDRLCVFPGTKVKYLVFETHQRCPFGGVTFVYLLMVEEDLMKDSAESAE